MPVVRVPAERVERWVANFEARHGGTALRVMSGALMGSADDGSTFTARLPFGEEYAGDPDPVAIAAAAEPPADWGVLLVRKGGFAVARLAGRSLTEHKIGQRHVQGRTKAGGQSQQRFARRRDNQARDAYRAAADHAARILAGLQGPLVTGGDQAAVREVLTDARLTGLQPVAAFHAVPDPRRSVLDETVTNALALVVVVDNADPATRPG